MTKSLFAAVIILLAFFGCSVKDKDAVSLPSPKATSPETAVQASKPDDKTAAQTAGAGQPADGVPFTGAVEPHRVSTLSPKVPGTVAKVHVREGDRVKEGDPLVTFDLKDVNLRLRQARAALEGAKIQREAAGTEWSVTKSLFDKKAAAKTQFDAADFKMRGAEVSVSAAEIAVEMGEKAVRDSVIRAPYDGVIVRRMVNEGDYATTMPPTQLIKMEETGILDLRIMVPSSEMNKIREGEPVTVDFPSLGTSIQANVTRVVSSIDSRTRNFSVIIEIQNPDGRLLSGLFAEARFERKAAGEAAP